MYPFLIFNLFYYCGLSRNSVIEKGVEIREKGCNQASTPVKSNIGKMYRIEAIMKRPAVGQMGENF